MNWLDGIIGFISPEWGARREAWRQSLTEMRNYDAGNYDRGNANWRVLNQSGRIYGPVQPWTMSEPEPETWSETPT